MSVTWRCFCSTKKWTDCRLMNAFSWGAVRAIYHTVRSAKTSLRCSLDKERERENVPTSFLFHLFVQGNKRKGIATMREECLLFWATTFSWICNLIDVCTSNIFAEGVTAEKKKKNSKRKSPKVLKSQIVQESYSLLKHSGARKYFTYFK